jgi:hypothetical protein
MKLSRGSQWAKWDLHLHSPLTHLANAFDLKKNGWEPYFEAISKAKINGIAITNYFFFAEEELEIVKRGLNDAGIAIPVLANLEFRIQQPNKNNEYINVHVLFSDSLPTKIINERIGRLQLINTRSDGRKIHCSHVEVRDAKLEIGNLMVDFDTLIKVLADNFKADEYLLICCLGGYGGMRPAKPIANEGRGASLAAELDKKCHCFFETAANVSFAQNKDRYEGAKAKAVLTGSDAHELATICNTTVWIKAELSFEGVKQVLYEPESRVSYAADNPASAFNKPSFESISLAGQILKNQTLSFTPEDIPLNRDLVAIIGGRGTGKSLLIDVLWRLFHRPGKEDVSRYQDLITEKTRVTFLNSDTDPPLVFTGDVTNALSYLHVRQGEIKTLAEDSNRLSTEVKRLIGIIESSPSSASYESVKYVELKSRISSIANWLSETNAEGQLLNTKQYQEELIKEMEGRISAITNTANQSLINKIQEVSENKSELTRSITDIEDLREAISSSDRSINRQISTINANLKGLVSIPSHSFNALTEEITRVKLLLEEAVLRTESQVDQLIQQLSKAGISIDASGLVAKAEMFQSAVSDAKKCLEQINKQHAELDVLTAERVAFTKSFLFEMQREKATIDSRFKLLTDPNDQWSESQNSLVSDLLKDIEVSGEVFFDQDEFYRLVMGALNLGKFRSTGTTSSEMRVRSYIAVHNLDDLVQLIEDHPIIDDELGLGNGKTLSSWMKLTEYFVSNPEVSLSDLLFYPRHIRKYLSVRAKITYRGKELSRLSVGQRGTLYLCMKLATDPFGSPFVFDQPEDDLDNEFIVSHLIPLVRKVKRYRQVILVTHNANIVVNGDAEQIIIAKNEDEKISYSTGGIEAQSPVNIRAEICTILEGGGRAFRSRDLRYGQVEEE